MISLPGRTVAFSLGRSPSIDSEVTDLPLPDSPTSATVAFLGMSKLMPLTASNIVSLSRRKLTRRLRTESRVSMAVVVIPSKARNLLFRISFELRIERIAQRIGEQAEGRDQHCHRRSG